MRTLLVGLVAVSLFGCSPGKSARLAQGDYVLQFTEDGSHFEFLRRNETLLAFGSDAFQLGAVTTIDPELNYDPYQAEPESDDDTAYPPDDLVWETASSFRIASVSTAGVVLEVGFHGGDKSTVTFSANGEGTFSATWMPTAMPQPIGFMRLRAQVDKTEAFYGLGEWGDQVNHRGRRRSTQIEPDLTMENDTNEAHVPIPFLTGTRGWGIFVASRRAGSFDVAKKQNNVVEATFGTAEQSSDGLTFHLFGADHPLDVTRRYYAVTSPPLLPATWALGPWLWRDEAVNEAQVLDDIDKVRDLDLATSGMWMDRPYATAVNTFDWVANKYTDPQMMIDHAHDMGLRMAVWSSPYLEPATGDLATQAMTKGYFPPKNGIDLNHWSHPLDLTNPDAYSFWQGMIHHYTDMGIEGFKLDYGEDVVVGLFGKRVDWLFANGETELTMHYGYTLKYHQVYAETIPQTGGYLLCRAGRWGDQARISVVWPGDMDATFTHKGDAFADAHGGKMIPRGVGGFPATVMYGLSLGPSGFPFFAADTGGYIHSPGTKELFVRWAEQTALSTVMNVGDSSSQMPWEFTADNGRDQEALDIYRIYARLHVRLFPYEWTYAQKLAAPDGGRPITRALGLAYPELGVHPNDEYLFGDDLLVAPVVTEGDTTRSAMLPTGTWIDWWDGTSYAGGTQVTIPAPLGKLPLLMREGAIVPLLRPTIDSMSPTTMPDRVDSFVTHAGPLYVRIVPGADGAFTIYDGTQISMSGSKVQVQYGNVFAGGMVLEEIHTPMPSSVTVDGNPIQSVASLDALTGPGWFWQSDVGGTLWINVPDGPHTVDRN